MHTSDLHRNLTARGFTLAAEGGSQLVVRPASQLSDDDRRLIRRHKQALLRHIGQLDQDDTNCVKRAGKPRRTSECLVAFHWQDQEIAVRRYRRSQGRVYSTRFALDCETEIVDFPAIPRSAMVSVSDGREHYLIHPDDLGAFALSHVDARIIFHNVAFDFWVVHRHLADGGEDEALRAWVSLARRRRFHDTMLLDMLLTIASGSSSEVRPRNLGVVAKEYAGLELDKEDPYRMRYGELIESDWSDVDSGFFRYAIKDAIATARAYGPMHSAAKQVMDDTGFDSEVGEQFSIRPDAVRRFGVLTEAIQVQAAIALDAIGRIGLHTDRKRLSRLKRRLDRELEQDVQKLNQDCPGLFIHDKAGTICRTAKTGVPRKSTKALDKYLIQAVDEINTTSSEAIDVPRTTKGQVAKSQDVWSALANKHGFVEHWLRYEQAAKLSQFPAKLNAAVIRPRYYVLTRTGRTSCSSPNIQQIPKQHDFRHVIVPSPGHLFLVVDYKFIELVTLAAVCLCRFGVSQLAEVIRGNVDPHCYTAAMLKGMTYQEFMRLKGKQPDEFKSWRQMAKPVNFGVPGGMGVEALRDYAFGTYCVQMSLDDAQCFHRRLVEDVYPELKTYLRDTSMEALASNLNASPNEIWGRLDRDETRSAAIPGSVRKIVAGTPWKADQTPYSERYVDRVWDVLNEVNRNLDFTEELGNRVGSKVLADRLFFARVPTLTGRVRGGVTYTTERNTPFQGLAADGAKLALARLVLAGHRVVGFVHDEVIVELPDEGGYVGKPKVQSVLDEMCKGMEEVTSGVPVQCDYVVSTCWSKQAQLVEQGDRVIAWKPDKS